MHVLAISGSLRAGSHNTALLQAAAELVEPDETFELWQELREIPPYDEDIDVEPAPRAVASLRDAVAAADAILIATPEYNHSLPGALKNALDWASRPFATNPFRGKPVVVIGASTGIFGAVWAQADVRKVLGAIGARVLDFELPVGQAADKFDASGDLVDDDVRAKLAEALALLARGQHRDLIAA